MRILVVGSGGREHALVWKLARSPRVTAIYAAPGNGGTAGLAENVAIAADDRDALVAFALDHAIDLTVVGPEVPLVAGLVDALQAVGLQAFGPTQAAARLEGSKAFAKRFMIEEGIPAAPAGIFTTFEAALAYVRENPGPAVIKASGLAAGKGVLICDNVAESEAALRTIMVERAFGAAGDEVLVETRLVGEEASVLAFCDGDTVVPMLPARDYKRALDGDAGLNTGGMGGFAPSPYVTEDVLNEVTRRVLQPVVDGMRRRGTPYRGVLYAGVMLTDAGPRVLEFNCRFGDPETQLLLPLLDSDLVDIMLACVHGTLTPGLVRWQSGYSAGIVLASDGYPGSYQTAKVIQGLAQAGQTVDAVFHAGTRLEGGVVLTSGGRVLAVTATGDTLAEARDRAYAGAAQITFDGAFYRHDIAADAKVEFRTKPASVSAYSAAGVDIDAGEKAVELMKDAVRKTYTPEVLGGIGAFGGSLSVASLASQHDLVLVATADGVGTKTMIAEQMGIYDTVGHDIVNHCVNDILVQGARPLIFLDYIAAAKLDPVQVATVVGGAAKACEAVGCVLIGGETAEMPGVYREGSFDLVGTMVGWVDRRRLLDGSAVSPGDVILGIPSNGLHTNGYSLARRIFAPMGYETVLPEFGKAIGEVLLAPHRPYLRELEALWQAGIDVLAMSHLTGGAYVENLPRVLPAGVGACIDRSAWDVPLIFQLIQKLGGVDPLEMYRVYNMGMGMAVIVSAAQVDAALAALPEMTVIGEATAWDGHSPRVRL